MNERIELDKLIRNMIMKDIDVLVIGRSCLDIISVVEQFPLEDTKIPLLYRTVEGGRSGWKCLLLHRPAGRSGCLLWLRRSRQRRLILSGASEGLRRRDGKIKGHHTSDFCTGIKTGKESLFCSTQLEVMK